MNTAVTTKKDTPLAKAQSFLEKLKPQMALALPKHLNADRMTRLALTAFSTNPDLQNCTPQSLASSIMLASQLGLEIGVGGQGYLGQDAQRTGVTLDAYQHGLRRTRGVLDAHRPDVGDRGGRQRRGGRGGQLAVRD